MEKHHSRNQLVQNKQQFSFICFDIEEFYPSISQDLLNKALDFASNYDNITTEERNIVIHAKNSILIHKHILHFTSLHFTFIRLKKNTLTILHNPQIAKLIEANF